MYRGIIEGLGLRDPHVALRGLKGLQAPIFLSLGHLAVPHAMKLLMQTLADVLNVPVCCGADWCQLP